MMKYVLFPWIVLVFATSAFGQANCSYGDSNGVSRDFIPPLTTSCPSGQNGTTFSNTLVVTSTEYCVNTNSGSTYASHNATVTGYGQTNCNTISNLTFPCYAAWEQDETDAANASDYNRFYLRAYDQSYVSSNTCVRNGGFRQDFWQCAGVACSGAPPCTVCPKGTPVTCYSPCGSPIILDIAGKGFNLTSAEEGVRFDIAGDGRPEQMGWTAKGAENAFLALPGPDGLVHNGKQLFGNFTPQPRSTTPNGFAALAVYDDPKSGGNGDGIAVISSIKAEIDKSSPSRRQRIYEAIALAALSSIPWVGGVLAAAASYNIREGDVARDSLIDQWMLEHHQRLQFLRQTLEHMAARLEGLGEEIDQRIHSEQYLALVRKTFRQWDEADTDEKRRLLVQLITNAAGTRISSDDIVRLFLDWLDTYHEAHLAVIREIQKNQGPTRYDIWVAVYGEPVPRDDSAEADLYKMLIRDLTIGGVIRQPRESDRQGRFLKKQRAPRRIVASASMESAFEDTKPYVLTELGSQFVHYAMTELVARLNPRSAEEPE